ncbi:MAG: hypothetical protein ACE5GX_01455 [Thermoanaerobaculia bacterium]
MNRLGSPQAERDSTFEAATSAGSDSGPTEHPSLALEHAIAPVRPHGGFVLDLGPATGANVSFFAGLCCKLFIADLSSSIFETASPVDRAEALDETLSRDIPVNETFDLVLLWDLLDYLDDAEIRILSARLRPACRDRTLLHSLVSFRKDIPDRPVRYEIRDSKTILYAPESQLRRPAPLRKEPELARLMPDFVVDSTYLLRHGRQEYLFQARPV